jgi:hypothetical protein
MFDSLYSCMYTSYIDENKSNTIDLIFYITYNKLIANLS